MPDAVVAVDGGGVIQCINAQAVQLFGYAPAELVGRPIEDLVPHDLRHRHAGTRAEYQAAPHVRRMGASRHALVALRKDGTSIPVDIGLGTIGGSDGPLTLAVVRDQSRTQALLDDLSRARRALEVELDQRRQMRSLTDLLQLHVSRQALQPVLSLHLEFLFPDGEGALFVFDERGARAEPLVAWGGGTWSPVEPAHCLAVQRGAPSGGDTAGEGCAHAGGGGRCAPLVAVGETLGILTVRPRAERLAGEDCRRIDMVADWLALPVANLRLRERLQELTHRDPLTGLFNRRYLDETLRQEMARAARHAEPLAIAILDLDHFKRLNDRWGHDAGDAVLRAFGGHLGRTVRASDVVCRYGGEEFVIICPGCTGPGLVAVLERIRLDWVAAPVERPAGPSLASTFSAGVAEHRPGSPDGAALLQAADQALYEAKRAGRDRVVLAAAAGGRHAAASLSGAPD